MHPGKCRIHQFNAFRHHVVDNHTPFGMRKDMLPLGQEALILFARRVVAENHDCAGKLAGFPNWRTDVSNFKGMPVFLPEHGIIVAIWHAVAAGCQQRTFFRRERAAIASAVMDDVMGDALAQVRLRITQHLLRCGIGERDPALAVHPKNAFTRELQDQLRFVGRIRQIGSGFPGLLTQWQDSFLCGIA
nr:hypothetical protein [Thiobacillus sp.]